MAHIEPSATRAQGTSQGDHLAPSMAIAQIGPVTATTYSGSPIVHFSGLSRPGALDAIQAQFGTAPSPLETSQTNSNSPRKDAFRQAQKVRRQQALQAREVEPELEPEAEPELRKCRMCRQDWLLRCVDCGVVVCEDHFEPCVEGRRLPGQRCGRGVCVLCWPHHFCR